MPEAADHVISQDVRDPSHPDRNLALELVRVTEAGALAAGPCVYMEKVATGPRAADLLSLNDPLEDVVAKIAERKGGDPGDVTVIMLDRPRHEEAVAKLREVGASIRFISDGDVAASLFAV